MQDKVTRSINSLGLEVVTTLKPEGQDGITDIVIEQTFDNKGIPISTISTYTQFGMRHWDGIFEPGIQVPNNSSNGERK